MPTSRGTSLAVLIAAISLGGSMPMTFAPIASNIAASLGNDLPGVAMAMSAYALGAAFNGVVVSPSIDLFGARGMLRVSLGIFAVAMLICSVSAGVPMLVSGHFLAGLAAGAVLSSSYVLATGIGEPAAAPRNLGRALAGWSVAMIVIAPLGGVIGDAVSWRIVYGAMTVLAAVTAFRSGGLREEPGRAGAARFPYNLAVLRLPPVALLIGIFFLHNVSFMGAYLFAAQVGKSSLHFGAAGASLLALMFGIGFALGSLSSQWSERLGAPNLIVAGLTIQALLYLAMPQAILSQAAYLALALLWGLVNQVLLANTVHLLAYHSPAEKGAVVGLNSAATYAGMAAGAAVSGKLFAIYGFGAVTWFCALCVGCGSLLALCYRLTASRWQARRS